MISFDAQNARSSESNVILSILLKFYPSFYQITTKIYQNFYQILWNPILKYQEFVYVL